MGEDIVERPRFELRLPSPVVIVQPVEQSEDCLALFTEIYGLLQHRLLLSALSLIWPGKQITPRVKRPLTGERGRLPSPLLGGVPRSGGVGLLAETLQEPTPALRATPPKRGLCTASIFLYVEPYVRTKRAKHDAQTGHADRGLCLCCRVSWRWNGQGGRGDAFTPSPHRPRQLADLWAWICQSALQRA